MVKTTTHAPIAVFDSGIGGLTVLKALRAALPYDSFVYLGDTARLPYGTKSPETIIQYSEAVCDILMGYKPKALVIACNTASAVAVPALRARLGQHTPVIDMIEPAAAAAAKATRNGHIGVIATNGTIRSGAYARAITRLDPALRTSGTPCQMLVALAEEGWVDHPATRATLATYLAPMFDRADAPDTLVLGCTHFPLFAEMIAEMVGPDIRLIHCGDAAANILRQNITAAGPLSSGNTGPRLSFMVTDGLENFTRHAATFFGDEISPHHITLVDARYAA